MKAIALFLTLFFAYLTDVTPTVNITSLNSSIYGPQVEEFEKRDFIQDYESFSEIEKHYYIKFKRSGIELKIADSNIINETDLIAYKEKIIDFLSRYEAPYKLVAKNYAQLVESAQDNPYTKIILEKKRLIDQLATQRFIN